MSSTSKKVLLYSGGADSWLIDKLWKPDVKLYVNIHGEYNDAEIKRLPKDVIILDAPFLGATEDPDTHFVPLRNLYFIMMASRYGDNICLGATKGDFNRLDKTPEFFEKTQELLRYTMGKQRGIFEDSNITRETRFVHMYKHEIIKEYIDNGGSINELAEQSFSCYTPIHDQECMNCRSCFKKYAEMTYFGYIYPYNIRKQMFNYVRNEILPFSKNDGHSFFDNRGSEGDIWMSAVYALYTEFDDIDNISDDQNK